MQHKHQILTDSRIVRVQGQDREKTFLRHIIFFLDYPILIVACHTLLYGFCINIFFCL